MLARAKKSYGSSANVNLMPVLMYDFCTYSALKICTKVAQFSS